MNFQLSHPFPDLTLTVSIQGEAPSALKIRAVSDVPGYSQDQLWSFVFGGDPSGDPANAAQDAGAAAGAAIASGIGSTYINRGLAKAHIPVPLRPDVLRYSAGTATSSASYEVGKWLKLFGNSLLVLYRLRQDALPTENFNEVEGEYYVGKHWLGDIDFGDRDYDTADLLYRLRW